MEAAETLAGDGIDTEVIDLRTLVPMDTETVLESVRKTGRLVVVDEDYRSFGVTGEVIARVTEGALDDLEAVQRVAVPDVPIPYSRPLEDEVIPGVADIEAAIRATQ
jgi:pyruvate dehydrogenase E1 component beta subunit